MGPARERETRPWLRALHAALDQLLPARCEGCDATVPWQLAPPSLCSACEGKIATPSPGCCPLCDRRTPGRDWLCAACRRRAPAFDSLQALWLYAPPVDAVLRSFKFSRRDTLAAPLGRLLVSRFESELAGVEAIVPVPLHWRRRLLRGYDQAELLAREVADASRRPLLPLLRRSRSTRAQSLLPLEQRKNNLRGAFTIRAGMKSAPRSVALIDDVSTTGSTLDAASRRLKAFGVSRVEALVLARTPRAGRRFASPDGRRKPAEAPFRI